jgi:hypothetical protein
MNSTPNPSKVLRGFVIVKQKADCSVRSSEEEDEKGVHRCRYEAQKWRSWPKRATDLTIVTFETIFYEIPLASALLDYSGGKCLLLSHVT